MLEVYRGIAALLLPGERLFRERELLLVVMLSLQGDGYLFKQQGFCITFGESDKVDVYDR